MLILTYYSARRVTSSLILETYFLTMKSVSGELTTTLDIGGQHTGMDMDYTCKVTVDSKEYDHVVDSKIFGMFHLIGRQNKYKLEIFRMLLCQFKHLYLINGFSPDRTPTRSDSKRYRG